MNDNQLYVVENLYYASVLADGNLGSIYFRGVEINNGVYRGRIRFAHGPHHVYISHNVAHDVPLVVWDTINPTGGTNNILLGNWQHNDTTTEVYGHHRHRSLGVFHRINVQGMSQVQHNYITNLLNVVVPALRQNQANVNIAILQAMLNLHNAIQHHII